MKRASSCVSTRRAADVTEPQYMNGFGASRKTESGLGARLMMTGVCSRAPVLTLAGQRAQHYELGCCLPTSVLLIPRESREVKLAQANSAPRFAGNEFESEVLPGALPKHQNNPRVRRGAVGSSCWLAFLLRPPPSQPRPTGGVLPPPATHRSAHTGFTRSRSRAPRSRCHASKCVRADKLGLAVALPYTSSLRIHVMASICRDRDQRRSWLYRIRPSVTHGEHQQQLL
jgi:hypothetical protein